MLIGACRTLREFGQGRPDMILDRTPPIKCIFLNKTQPGYLSPYLVNLSYPGCSHFIFIPTCDLILFSLLR